MNFPTSKRLILLLLTFGLIFQQKLPHEFKVVLHKKVKGTMPCITCNFVDAKNGKPLIVGAIIINGAVFRADNTGVVKAEVLAGKYKVMMSFYSYTKIEKTLTLHKGDSLVITSPLKRSHEILE